MAWSDFESDFSPYLDFAWYACDADGKVAILTSAGFGPVPHWVFRSRPEYELVRACMQELPERSKLSATGQLVESCWTAAERRGLFAYDWNAVQGQPMPRRPYRRQAFPSEPVMLSELPNGVRVWLEKLRFASVSFDSSLELWPEQAFDEFEP